MGKCNGTKYISMAWVFSTKILMKLESVVTIFECFQPKLITKTKNNLLEDFYTAE